jgi:two-component system response regulator VicR
MDTQFKEKRNVLVVEDEKPLQDVIKTKIEHCGCAVVTARTVEQAMDYLEQEMKIDVIWLDHYLLGKETGLDLVAKLKAEGSKWKDIPIFVVSNTASEDKVKCYLALGVTKYYTKADYKLDFILSDIKKHLEEGE